VLESQGTLRPSVVGSHGTLKLGSWVAGAPLLRGDQELGNEPCIKIGARDA
jgi:hypothetical protein